MRISTYTEDTPVKQATADYLKQKIGSEPVYACNNEDFGTDSLSGSGTVRTI